MSPLLVCDDADLDKRPRTGGGWARDSGIDIGKRQARTGGRRNGRVARTRGTAMSIDGGYDDTVVSSSGTVSVRWERSTCSLLVFSSPWVVHSGATRSIHDAMQARIAVDAS